MFLRRGTVTLALGGALAVATLPTIPASAGPGDPVVKVSSGAGGLSVNTSQVDAGQIVFRFSSTLPASPNGPGGSDVEILRRTGASMAAVTAHIRLQVFGDQLQAAASTRWLADPANVVLFGGAAIAGVGSAQTVNTLPAGSYQLLDVNSVLSGGAVDVASLEVVGHVHPSQLPRISATIDTTSADRFRTTATELARDGRFLVRNTSDTIHFALFQPVAAATTDRRVDDAIADDTLGQLFTLPPGDNRIGVQSDVLSPGRQQVFSSDSLSPGTYDLECFIADDVTGVPHFFMGMHKIVQIR